jgi:hypothetical protein
MNASIGARVRMLIGLIGLAFISVYLAAALGWVKDVSKLLLVLVFAIGPAAIVGAWMIRDRLERTVRSSAARLGTVFLTIAFSMFTLMLVVQQTVRLRYLQMSADAADQTIKASLKQVYGVVDLVQQGIDVSFDIFYCVGLILLAAAMYRRPDFGRFLSVFGMAVGAALLVFNLWTFPYIPADSGLIDLGPVTGLWWTLVILQILRRDLQQKRPAKRDQPTSLP